LFYGYIIVGVAFFIHLTSYGLSDSFGVFINPWINDFGWARATISGAYSLSFVLIGVLGIVMGLITDRYGPRMALSICGVCLGAGFFLLSKMYADWQLFLFYGLIFGTGMSGFWAPLLSVISRWFIGKRGLMTGIVISGGGIGAFIGPPVINWLINISNWRQTTIILGIFVFVVIFLAAQFLKRDPSQVGQQPYEDKDARQLASDSTTPATHDYSTREALKTPQFWIVFSMLFCLAFYTFSVMVHVTPHAIDMGITNTSAANILAVIGGAGVIGNFVMGRVCDKIGPKKIFIICFILMSAALFWLAQARYEWMLYLFSIIFGFNHGANATAQAPILARIFGMKALGAIFGAAAFGFTIGGAIGPLLTGYLYDLTGSYQTAFIICGILGLFGLILTLFLRPTERIKVKI
jgi:MFS family permease